MDFLIAMMLDWNFLQFTKDDFETIILLFSCYGAQDIFLTLMFGSRITQICSMRFTISVVLTMPTSSYLILYIVHNLIDLFVLLQQNYSPTNGFVKFFTFLFALATCYIVYANDAADRENAENANGNDDEAMARLWLNLIVFSFLFWYILLLIFYMAADIAEGLPSHEEELKKLLVNDI